jgi:hypothetical protein
MCVCGSLPRNLVFPLDCSVDENGAVRECKGKSELLVEIELGWIVSSCVGGGCADCGSV